jgi:hypothetical protein
MMVPGAWNCRPPSCIGSDFIARPATSLVTMRSPIWMGARVASTLTLTRPVVATSTLPSPASPREMPGWAEMTPATRVS